jgi:hypothetical protein
MLGLTATLVMSGPASAQTRPYVPWLTVKASDPAPAPRIINWIAQPTYAIAPRSIGITYGPHYFERQAYAGPARRGQAYNVRRRTS